MTGVEGFEEDSTANMRFTAVMDTKHMGAQMQIVYTMMQMFLNANLIIEVRASCFFEDPCKVFTRRATQQLRRWCRRPLTQKMTPFVLLQGVD